MNNTDLESFIRPDLRSLVGYVAHKSPDTLKQVPAESVIKLDANENPYGCSPRVMKSLERADFAIYPDAAQTRLREGLAQYAGVTPESIVAANGSGELLDYVLRLFVAPGDEVINCVPTFDMYRFRTLLAGGKLVNIMRARDFALDVKEVKRSITDRTRLIVLANPNNPTGNTASREQIIELAESGIPLLVDEAYYEFCGETVVPLMRKYPDLMVLRTLSKWAGLAGLRIGYGIFPPKIAAYLMKFKLPYCVSTAASAAARVSLEDAAYLMGRVKAITAERETLFGRLSDLSWLRPYPSKANFIYATLLRGNAREMWLKLQERGVLVRYYDQPLVENGLRFSVGRPEQTDALITALIGVMES